MIQTDERYTQVLLELLKVFPEELQNKAIRIGENRRTIIQRELAALTSSVLSFLVSCKRSSQCKIGMRARIIGDGLPNKQCAAREDDCRIRRLDDEQLLPNRQYRKQPFLSLNPYGTCTFFALCFRFVLYWRAEKRRFAIQQSPDCRDDVHAAAATAVSNVLAFCEDLKTCRELATMTKDALFQTADAFDYATRVEDLDKSVSARARARL